MKKVIALLLTVMLIASSTAAFACTGFYVGKNASVDGTSIIGHTVDGSTSTQTITCVVPRVENQPGRVYRTFSGIEYPLPDTTYQYTTNPMPYGSMLIWDGGTSNEMGVSISSAVTCYITDEIAAADPVVSRGGLSEGFMCALVGLCCASAREAIQLLSDYIDTYGNAEQNSFFIADQNEVWYMETYTGHQWCAVKAPDDCVSVFGNEFMLGAVDVNSEDVIASKGLISMPEEAGLAVFTEDGLIDLFATYSGGKLANASNRRTWYGHYMLAPSTAGEYATKTRYPLFYQPDEKVSVDQIFEVTRARFEGTQWCPETTGRMDQRVIGTEKQGNIQAIQTYSDLPAAMACVTWACMANAEHSVYIPQSNLITDVAESYKYYSGHGGINPDMAHYIYKRLCALSEQDRYLYGTGVREYWHNFELDQVANFPTVLAETEKLYATDPAAAAKYITEYTIDLQNKALDDAKLMYDELTWYMIVNTNAQKYSYDSETMTMGDTWNPVPFVPSIAAK